jgi:ketosteroid isomerase-like protein
MRKMGMGLMLGLVAFAGAAWSQGQPSAATEKAITALENQWLQSFRTNDPDLVAPLLAEKFVGTDVAGKISNKTEYLAENKTTKFASADYENLKVMVFGTTAIAIGGFKGKGTDSKGKPFNDHSSWTDTWIKMPNGKWQCVASQDTLITM